MVWRQWAYIQGAQPSLTPRDPFSIFEEAPLPAIEASILFSLLPWFHVLKAWLPG